MDDPVLLTLALVLGIGAFWLVGGAVVLVRYLRRNRRGTRQRRDGLPYRKDIKQ